MKLTALVERVNDEKYRALIPFPLSLESEGATSDEAVERLREKAIARLKDVKVVEISIPTSPENHPLAKWVGIWKDHPDFEEFRKNIAEYREQS